MSTVAAWTLALLAALAQDGRKLTAEPDRRIELDLQHFYPARQLQVTWSALATAYPDLVRVESLGSGRGGEQLSVVTVGRFDGGDPNQRPALLVVGSIGRDDLFGAELALTTVWQLVLDNGRDAAVSEVLDRCTLYFVPCLDAQLRERVFAELEGREDTVEPRAVALDRNFPSRWDPLTIADGGPYPLSEPEARALAEFLVARPNVAVVQRYRAGAPRPTEREGPWPEADRRVQREFAAEFGLEGFSALEQGEGRWLTFAYLQHGSFVFCQPFAFEGRGPWALPPVLQIQPLGRAAAAVTLKLARALPRLGATLGAIEALGEGQWSVEVAIENTGRLPTTSALGSERGACGAPSVTLDGGDLLAAAVVQDGVAEPVACTPHRVELDELPAGGRTVLRLFVAAPAASEITLSASAPRAGSAAVAATLR